MRLVGRVGWLLGKVFGAAIWLVCLILVLLVAYRITTLPKVGGELALPGLRSDTSVTRDGYAIPHIRSASVQDATYSLGFVHAQDRLWQLEMHRRLARAELAEILGEPALATDRFLRTLGVSANAKLILERLDPDTRALIKAYVDGINAAIALTRDNPVLLSPEFFALTTRPQLWQESDVIAWQTMMAWDLSGNLPTELLRFELATRLSPEKLAQLLDTEPAQVLPDLGALYSGLLSPILRSAESHQGGAAVTRAVHGLLDLMPATAVEGIGSNQWAISGRHTVSGKPLLANDPHLALTAPALWYLAHLSAPGLDVIGGTIPGLPYVIAGRNDFHAWGLTTSAIDTQDLYLERLVAQDPSRYETPGGNQAFEVREEIIRVKGGAQVRLLVRSSRHGPIISDVYAPLADALKQGAYSNSYVMALKWAALSVDDFTIRAGLRLNRAKNWQEFRAALEDFSAPPQNISYANTDGFTALVVAGRAPVRGAANDLLGLAPAPGWDARYDWQGFVPLAQMPYQENPSNGYLVNANEAVATASSAPFLGAEWALPFRSQRIGQLLQAQGKHDMKSMMAIQADVTSLAVRELLPVLRQAKASSSVAADALALLQQWNGEMDGSRPEPIIAAAWIDQLRRDLINDEVGAASLQRIEMQRSKHRLLQRALTEPAYASWCDDVRTAAVEACAQLLSSSLETTLSALSRRFGGPMEQWRYDGANFSVSEHRPFGKNPLLARFFDLRSPSGGDTFTVNVARNDPWHASEPFASRWAASYRAIYDLANPNNSQFMQSTGQSGHRLSPHYADLNRAWATNRYVPMLTERAAIDKSAQSLLMLKPLAGAAANR